MVSEQSVFTGITNHSSALNAGRGIGWGGCAWQLSCSHRCCLLACDPLLESSQPAAALGAQAEFLPLYNVRSVGKLSHVHLFCPKPVFCAESCPRFSPRVSVEHVVSQISNNLLISLSGQGDVVRCFYCDGGVRSWSFGDDPWREHAKWYPE